jgi:hypothetical protein
MDQDTCASNTGFLLPQRGIAIILSKATDCCKKPGLSANLPSILRFLGERTQKNCTLLMASKFTLDTTGFVNCGACNQSSQARRFQFAFLLLFSHAATAKSAFEEREA